jgi:hypothetical protein
VTTHSWILLKIHQLIATEIGQLLNSYGDNAFCAGTNRRLVPKHQDMTLPFPILPVGSFGTGNGTRLTAQSSAILRKLVELGGWEVLNAAGAVQSKLQQSRL